jgi:CopG family transcriptional regulator/antitoxin EndoAI
MFYNVRMRNTRTLCATLPPDMLKRAQLIAKKESRTMSELIREALRNYERRAWWDSVNAYGSATAARQGIVEGDVERLVQEVRTRKRAARR